MIFINSITLISATVFFFGSARIQITFLWEIMLIVDIIQLKLSRLEPEQPFISAPGKILFTVSVFGIFICSVGFIHAFRFINFM